MCFWCCRELALGCGDESPLQSGGDVFDVAVWCVGGDVLYVSVYIYPICRVVSPWSLYLVVDVADVDDLVVGFARWLLVCCFVAFYGDGGVFEYRIVCDAFACSVAV